MREDQRRAAGVMDDELLSKLLPDPPSTSSDAERIMEAHSSPKSAADLESSSMKRGVSFINPITVIPKKRSRIPALANVAAVTESGAVDKIFKKMILMIREKLGACLT